MLRFECRRPHEIAEEFNDLRYDYAIADNLEVIMWKLARYGAYVGHLLDPAVRELYETLHRMHECVVKFMRSQGPEPEDEFVEYLTRCIRTPCIGPYSRILEERRVWASEIL